MSSVGRKMVKNRCEAQQSEKLQYFQFLIKVALRARSQKHVSEAEQGQIYLPLNLCVCAQT